jgi:hypothetical protein
MDFAAGISIFLVTVAFAFTFVPGIIEPFDGDDVGDPVTANRIADTLTSDQLASPEEPNALNESAVDDFFDEPSIEDELPVRDTTSVNVTIENGTVLRSTGDPVPERSSVTVAWRVVSYQGDRADLIVRVW